MINALKNKLGAETIFGIIESQMYGTTNSKQEPQETRPNITPRPMVTSEPVFNEHGCATAETSSQNLDQVVVLKFCVLLRFNLDAL